VKAAVDAHGEGCSSSSLCLIAADGIRLATSGIGLNDVGTERSQRARPKGRVAGGARLTLRPRFPSRTAPAVTRSVTKMLLNGSDGAL
jgi:hypothetical protein